MRLRHCCGSSPVCSAGFFLQLWLFFISSPFDKLQNQVDNKSTGKDVQQGAQGPGGGAQNRVLTRGRRRPRPGQALLSVTKVHVWGRHARTRGPWTLTGRRKAELLDDFIWLLSFSAGRWSTKEHRTEGIGS